MTLTQLANGGIEQLQAEIVILRVIGTLLLITSLVLFFKLRNARDPR